MIGAVKKRAAGKKKKRGRGDQGSKKWRSRGLRGESARWVQNYLYLHQINRKDVLLGVRGLLCSNCGEMWDNCSRGQRRSSGAAGKWQGDWEPEFGTRAEGTRFAGGKVV